MMITTWALCAALAGTPESASVVVVDKNPESKLPAVAVTIEGALHGFAGSGLVVSLNPDGRWVLDGGFGWSPAGLTAGVRGRVNFPLGPVLPFVGVGLSRSFGAQRDLHENGQAFARIEIPDSTYMQALAGVSYVRRSGLFLLWGIGYQRLLGDSNVRVLNGIISKEAFSKQSDWVGSGIVLNVAGGYTF